MTENKRTNTYLSKSLFIKGLQCPKSLYLHKYHPELRDEIDESKEMLFKSGHEVGILAQKLYPSGITIPYEGLSKEEQINKTKREIENGATIIYEASFSYNDVFIKADIMRKEAKGWNLYEVKSSLDLKDYYLDDIAIQYYVLQGLGIPVSKAFLVHINNKYVRDGDIEVHRLFAKKDLTKIIRQKQDYLGNEIKRLKDMLKGDMPEIDIGEQCDDPYECDFRSHCWRHIPEDSIFSIESKWIDKFAYYKERIICLKDLPLDKLNNKQRIYVDTFLNKKDFINKEGIKEFLDSLRYPLCFLDFETTYMVAIPLFNRTKPYQQVPFQYSLHYRTNEGAKLEHKEYLADAGIDPRRPFLESLLNNIRYDACILVYNKTFETKILRLCQEWFPEYRKRIDRIIDNMIDLMTPFRRKDYYTWQMYGSHSLKYVLPALIPAMNYDALEISDGQMASDEYMRMYYSQDAEEIAMIRESLLEYCRQDTLAMVKILERLKEVVKED